MSLLKKLFSSNGHSDVVTSQSVIPEVEGSNNDFKEMFIDNTMPEADLKTESQNVFAKFFKYNFFSIGYNDGYDYHSAESYERGKQSIKLEFQQLIRARIEQIKNEINELSIDKLQNEGLPGNILEQFELKISRLNEIMDSLREELILSDEYSGAVRLPVEKYSEGFLKGNQQYANEKLLGGSTGLFN